MVPLRYCTICDCGGGSSMDSLSSDQGTSSNLCSSPFHRMLAALGNQPEARLVKVCREPRLSF